MLALGMLGLGLPAHALQLVEASDGVAVEAVLSLKEPTRLRIEDAAITDVFGNIHSNQCGNADAGPGLTPGVTPAAPGAGAAGNINLDGDIIIACDRGKGEIYLRPVGDSSRPVNLFVSSATATYTLLLRRADTPADTIVIRDRTPRAQRRQAQQSPPAGPAPSHVRTMKALLVAMASGRIPSDVRVEDVRRTLHLWPQVQFTLLRQYEGRGLIGERYTLKNIGAEPMALAEQAFYRPDSPAGGEITGIAIEHHKLEPGDTTTVYVLRRGGSR
ncbi:type-F conjugative transfer system secretin TraK [Pseudorhodoferax soli]|uniref:type-F conjugative transfer system secretin TraK n=1 Tax=Pseudorhodoferax soli TaxID=545864 RepID=UPI001FE79E53|nr:type-F conjugative transfer system secretin TraK [Pseudorhodoferax soli]